MTRSPMGPRDAPLPSVQSCDRHDGCSMARQMAHECVVYLGRQGVPEELGASLSAEQRAHVEWRPADVYLKQQPFADVEPVVMIADNAQSDAFEALRNAPSHVVILAKDQASAQALGHRADFSLADVRNPVATARLLHIACRLAVSRHKGTRMMRQLARTDDEYRELGQVGMALMSEHDLDDLIQLILRQGKRLTESDAGAFLFLELDENGNRILRPVAYKVDSLRGVTSTALKYPIDNTSMVGYAALTKEPVVVANSRDLPPGTPFHPSDALREEQGYWARGMLAMPMFTQKDALLGVLAFMNRKSDPRAILKDAASFDRYVVPYEDRHVRLTRALASMAAVSIENAQLHGEIEHIFESFLKAAVSAVDARDPTTAGHSLRVASLTAGLAEAVERVGSGTYRDLRFTAQQMRELRFAALLHDIGKVAVREDVLVKAKKLPPILWERVNARFDLIRRTMELERCKQDDGQCVLRASGDGVDEQLAAQIQELERLREIVRAANEPDVLAREADASLRDIAQRTFHRADGRAEPYITPEELHFLQIARGTLDEQERSEIESHVQKTHQFLNGIPWTDNLRNLVTYASGHHEKLNGTGYPKGLTERDIPVQTRLITLADMFDALTSSDRPYKSAVPADKALDIIRREADEGMLDRELVNIMTESHVYESILGQDWRQL